MFTKHVIFYWDCLEISIINWLSSFRLMTLASFISSDEQ
jgi:hypothetical protein